jgi:predicted GNAT family acetyltransferase
MSDSEVPVGGTSSIEVHDDPERSRYGARLGSAGMTEGLEAPPVAGFAAYRLRGEPTSIVVFTHTEVDPAYEGKGVGSALARAALDDVRARGLGVVAICPFISAYIRRHPEYADLLR